MTTLRRVQLRAGVVALLLAGAPACALTSRGAELRPRYFSPNVAAQQSEAALSPPSAGALELRLGQIEAASHLEERMAYRVSPAELGYHEDQRWTEQPYEFLRRALERELFERRRLRRVVTGAANTLDVELTAFEELRGPTPRVRLALSFTLHDEHESLLERSFVVERPLPPVSDAERPERVAEALGEALADAVARVSDAVQLSLAATASAPAPCTSADGPRARR